MKKFLKVLVVFGLVGGVAVLAGTQVAITGKKIRGVPGRNAEVICQPVTLPRAGTIVDAASGGDGFWIEDTLGVVNEFRDPRQALGVVLPAGGPYRVIPFLKKDQDIASAYITVRLP
ncbi:MAG: hypothetical protein U0931_25560 [Vulcanimicrobiota bacterium]